MRIGDRIGNRIGERIGERKGEEDRRFYLAREPVILTVLSVLVILLFAAVTALSHLYHGQEQSLGRRWYERGSRDLGAGKYAEAVSGFRSALLYQRDDSGYQLKLAEGLMGEGRLQEASAYLRNLWEREPEDAWVNLYLARIAVQQRDTEDALRYYHNAIYATWTGGAATGGTTSADAQAQRNQARLELVNYLLSIGDRVQAQAELIALAANLGDDPAQQLHVGELFLQAHDYDHAVAEFRLCLKSGSNNAAALAGAGDADFELGHYEQAEHDLQAASNVNSDDAAVAAKLNETETILGIDPFQRHLATGRKYQMVAEAFAVAGERLKSCPAAGNFSGNPSRSPGGSPGVAGPSGAPAQSLAAEWASMAPQITEAGLRKNPELMETAMELVFEIERRSVIPCGEPSGRDLALLRIAELRQGS